MKALTEKQIEKINKNMNHMSESQKDIYMQKLTEAGFFDKVLASFGSPTKNLEKLKTQQQESIKQIQAMMQAIEAAPVSQTITQEAKDKDTQALQAILDKLTAVGNDINNIKLDDNPAPTANNNQQNNGNNTDVNNNGGEQANGENKQ